MKYRRRDAKAYAREHFKGIWAAALTPFTADLAIDEKGLRRNFRHWVDDLGIDGVFVSGKQGEFFAMSVAERKRTFDIRLVRPLAGLRPARDLDGCCPPTRRRRSATGWDRAAGSDHKPCRWVRSNGPATPSCSHRRR